MTTTTTPYVWSDEQNGWVLGTPQVEVVREFTPAYGVQCEVEPVMPTWVDECGPANAYWAFQNTEQYYYIPSGSFPDSLVVQAYAQPGYTLVGETFWSNDESNLPCPPEDEETTLATPILNDECGTENDWASVPENSAGVSYYWASEDVTNFDVYAVVNEGYVVNTIPSGWTATDTSWVFIYYWSPVWTDVPCEVTPPNEPPTEQPEPQPEPKPAAVVTPVTTLAATGSDNNLLVPIGGGIVVVLGIGLALFGAIRRVRA